MTTAAAATTTTTTTTTPAAAAAAAAALLLLLLPLRLRQGARLERAGCGRGEDPGSQDLWLTDASTQPPAKPPISPGYE